MYAGGADDRKNLHRLIQAFSNLPDQILEKHQLVLAGKMPIARVQSLRKNAKKCGLKASKLIFTGYVSDEELSILYSNCKIFVFPSLHEGFGLPPLEAMNYGAIVIASNTTSLPEVVGNPEALFDPLSVESISQKLMQSLTDNAFRDRALLHGAEQVKLFSWDKSAKLAILAMEHVSKKWYEEEKYKQNFERINRATVIDALSKTEISKGVDDGYVRSLANSMALNEPRIGEIQLLLDISTIVHSDAKSGIQRVVRSLLWELLSNPPVGYIVRPIFLDGTVYRYAAVSEFGLQSGVILKKQPLTFFWAGDIYLALDLNMHLVPVMHILHEAMRARGVSLNFIVYDLLLASNPEWWLQPNPKLFLDWLKSICSVADNLICISDSVRQELKHWIGENNSFQITGLPNLKYFHLGADIENSQPSRGVPSDSESKLSKLQQGISFLMVGTIEPRKGHKQVLDAFELIWKSDSDSRLILVIVGKAGWLVDTLIKKIVNHKELGKRLFWFEGVSDEYINRIYSASDCLVAASYGEGFGLPLIEAAQHGLPIIARNIPVFKEVAGESAFYFDGVTPEEFLDSIVTWHDLYQKFLHPRTEGLQYLTWKKCTEDLIKTLNIQTYSGYNGAAD
jgi:glycosyltransferase involved in cell wall biosynthesis